MSKSDRHTSRARRVKMKEGEMILLKLFIQTVSTLYRASSSSQTSCGRFGPSVQVFPAERQPSRTVTDGSSSARYMNAVRNVAFVSERLSGEGK